MDKKLPYNPNSVDYKKGAYAGAHRMADFLIRALEEKYPGSLDLYSFVEEKKWECLDKEFKKEFYGIFDDF